MDFSFRKEIDPATRIFESSVVLLVGLLLSWFLPATITVIEPPGPLPWYRYGELWAVILIIPVSIYIAAKRWFRASVFFSFGCMDTLPLAWFIFSPLSYRAKVEEIQCGAWITFVCSILAGYLAVVVGRFVTRFQPLSGRKG